MKKADIKKLIEATEAKLEKIENAQRELEEQIDLKRSNIANMEASLEAMKTIESRKKKK